MSKWIHLQLKFKNYNETMEELIKDASQKKPSGTYKDLLRYLEQVVNSLLSKFIARFYFFFEGEEHPLFLALELNDKNTYSEAIVEIGKVPLPNFIISAIPTEEGTKEPDEAIGFYQAGTKFAFHRANQEYNPDWYVGKEGDIIHLLHCFCNQTIIGRSLFVKGSIYYI